MSRTQLYFLALCLILLSVSYNDGHTVEPWLINKGICPPMLCPTPRPQLRKRTAFPFLEGDIVLSSRLQRVLNEQLHRRTLHARRTPAPLWLSRSARSVVRPDSRLWPHGVVTYEIDGTLSQTTRRIIRAAFSHIESRTCVRFRPRGRPDRHFVAFINQPGCWSSVGKVGGRQLLALGYGCANFGTILHEICHALGFWHEQSRRDRDKYVKIVKRNIAPGARNQFGKRPSRQSSSRGYPYDYESVTHYGNKYYSKNNQPTIKIIGVGKALRMRIGQRRVLSDLDVAQLNHMYSCHSKPQQAKTNIAERCPADWVSHASSCYRVVRTPELSLSDAHAHCETLRGHLLHVNTRLEERFITSMLLKMSPVIRKIRIGARKAITNGKKRYVWLGSSNMTQSTDLESIWPTKDFIHRSVALVRRGAGYAWRSTWAGRTHSARHALPFICEQPRAGGHCFQSKAGDGREYRGSLAFSQEGVTCQRWTSQYPHAHNITVNKAEGIGDHNYCRNPHGTRSRPWCYVTLLTPQWQFCDVMPCAMT